MSPPARTNMVRLVFLGAAGVDKAPLIHRFLHDRVERKYTCTDELHVLEYVSAGSGGKVRLDSRPCGSCASGTVTDLVRPRVDDPGSLAEVRRLRDGILKQRGGKGAPIVVVGSKADLSELEGRQLSAADVMTRVEGHSDAGSVVASRRKPVCAHCCNR